MDNSIEKKPVTIYTDGACSGNPGPGGYGAILIYGNIEKEISGAKVDTTNNIMELTAVVEALKTLKEPCDVTIYSDSAYVVNAFVQNWVESWLKRGWKNSANEPVKNATIWKELLSLMNYHNVKYVKVKGHSDNEYNNRCDKLARVAIDKVRK